MEKIFVIGHVNPDTDSIASAMGYAWFLSEHTGDEAVAARAGTVNDQTSWVLSKLGLQPPILLADASPRVSAVTQRLDTVTPDRSLGEAWALANRTGFVAPVVSEQREPHSLITGLSLFAYLSKMFGPHIDKNDLPLRELFERPCKEVGDDHVPKFQEDLRIRDALPRILREERNEFWVVDENDRYVGICRQRNLLNPPRLKLILVDHNEIGQALGSLEEADLLEVLDHHRLGNPPTHLPIRFNVDIVGSTSTLVAERIVEAGMSTPPALAALLLAGLISDTLLFSSPTTTDRDHKAAERLGRWAFIGDGPLQGESLQSFGEQVLKAGTDLNTRAAESVVRSDLKIYDTPEAKFGIAQVEVTDINKVSDQIEPLGKALAQLGKEEGLEFAILMITDIVEASSQLLFRGNVPFLNELPFRKLPDGTFRADEVVSRKIQLLPILLALVEE
jgi:manganese-dependent inorganic pyrophosphatase